MDLEARLVEIEMSLANLEKIVEDLNEVIVRQDKEIENLKKNNKYISDLLEAEVVKPLSEETPPPHY